MIQDPVLRVDRLGKAFKSYSHELGRVLSWFSARYGQYEEKWILRDISFAIEPGQSLAIIGQNGAGKSTLLKMITGTLRASEGQVHLKGQIAAILELGMGFNPDLTGRQNVFQAGGLLGHSHHALEGKMDEIEAFAEIGSYFDQPMRVYSSGMQMRVAFALATAFRPDILIVDEALSVGDAYFQQKCFDRVERFREAGTAFILVSHDRAAILNLCERAILLDRGRIAKDGAPDEIMDYYNAMIGTQSDGDISTELVRGRVATRSGTYEATVEAIALHDAEGHPIEVASVGSQMQIRATIAVHAPVQRLVFGYAIKNRMGQTLFGINTHYTDQELENLSAGDRVDVTVSFPLNIAAGDYSITTSLSEKENHVSKNYEWCDLAATFSVVNTARQVFDGLAFIPPTIEVTHRPADQA
ncbi:ABC transporter ATP-binding protein [Pararhizobium haloflavum]|uniref:ABC transporter ATP-binding protein n=1 Tax=Pararhizobium haloflavum TaxID=2037914 RepID=UPI001FDFC400|nr:ABC transporter ATP-binding protein [Pararhizobium haloflavum]